MKQKGHFVKNPKHLNLNYLIFNHFMKKMSEKIYFLLSFAF